MENNRGMTFRDFAGVISASDVLLHVDSISTDDRVLDLYFDGFVIALVNRAICAYGIDSDGMTLIHRFPINSTHLIRHRKEIEDKQERLKLIFNFSNGIEISGENTKNLIFTVSSDKKEEKEIQRLFDLLSYFGDRKMKGITWGLDNNLYPLQAI